MSVIEMPLYAAPVSEPDADVLKLRDKLLAELEKRIPYVKSYEDWYDGNHPIPDPPEMLQANREMADRFRSICRNAVTNYVSLVADAPADRLQIVGFRFGEPENVKFDDEAWRIWQRNHLDADFPMLLHKTLVTGNSFMLVWPENGTAKITIEHPAQAIVKYAAGSRRDRVAGLKCWREDDGSKRVVLYLPAEVYKWRSRTENGPLEEWQPSTDDTWPITNPLGEVPLVEFRANPDTRPTTYGGGRSEFAGVLPIQRRINGRIAARDITADYYSHPQIWATGWTPDDPSDFIRMAVGAAMAWEDADVNVGQFRQASFTPFDSSVEADLRSMAAITRTPTFYTLQSVSNISGETLAALSAGLVAKCKRHAGGFGEEAETVERISLKAEGSPRAADVQSMVQWDEWERVTLNEKSNAAVQYLAAGVPKQYVHSDVLGIDPQDVKRFPVMLADEALFAPDADATP